jgi:hypothetical protein
MGESIIANPAWYSRVILRRYLAPSGSQKAGHSNLGLLFGLYQGIIEFGKRGLVEHHKAK